MEKNFTTRTGLIIGEDGIEKLKNSNVIVFGVGGVGSFAAEAIARAGVGKVNGFKPGDVESNGSIICTGNPKFLATSAIL